MNNLRQLNLHAIAKTPFFSGQQQAEDIFNAFGDAVFHNEILQQYLDNSAYEQIQTVIRKGSKINLILANQIAAAMKTWARAKGATHYTHWFQPLTGSTAEKHDALFDLTQGHKLIEKFEGNQLVQQEPDASSFPSGGIRNTFEARGYTAWDPTSPAFIYDKTLCIPTIFVSYTGEALDYKTPLLKSLSTLDEAATEICKYFDKSITKVYATLGWEQEYFLIDRSLVQTRPDLLLCGRTLLGHAPAKGQQLNDHYFGSIPGRVMQFMKELEQECMLLGIPLKTRHNEVAPGQYELAPVFEEANLSVDHNALLMEIMKHIGLKHNFEIFFHEKPFAGINGSGKHCNWSLMTDQGINLLSPGKTPMSNLQFLTFFINTIAAVLRHEALLGASTASASNDLRLGNDEAPPTILSVYIGKQLQQVLHDLENVSKGKLSPEEKTDLKLNVVGKIPEILLDNTDRNRTSPFAFTGNKFEFRTVGAKSNCAQPLIALNAMVAEQLKEFRTAVDVLIDQKGMKKDDAIFNLLRDRIKTIKEILYEGDGYNEAWIKEAAKRGLSNYTNTPQALSALKNKETVHLFEKLNILSPRELQARHQVALDEYTLRIQIEARTLGDLARNHIIPTAIKYQNILIKNVKGIKALFGKQDSVQIKEQLQLIKAISNHIAEINAGITKIINARKKANTINSSEDRAMAYANEVQPLLETIRYHCDKLELTVDDEIWPLAKYRELLFLR